VCSKSVIMSCCIAAPLQRARDTEITPLGRMFERNCLQSHGHTICDMETHPHTLLYTIQNIFEVPLHSDHGIASDSKLNTH